MNIENNETYSKNKYYTWEHKEILDTIDVYHKYINWVRGEFDLNLIVESSALEIYFPNGKFNIQKTSTENSNCQMEIYIESKSRKSCEKIKYRLESIFNHLTSHHN